MGDHAGRLGAQSMGGARPRATRTARKAALRGFAAPASSIVRSDRRWESPSSQQWRRASPPPRPRIHPAMAAGASWTEARIPGGPAAEITAAGDMTSNSRTATPTSPRPTTGASLRPPTSSDESPQRLEHLSATDVPSHSRHPREQPRTPFAERSRQPAACFSHRDRGGLAGPARHGELRSRASPTSAAVSTADSAALTASAP